MPTSKHIVCKESCDVLCEISLVDYIVQAGKTLLPITNSDYVYTEKMMAYVFDPYLPLDMN